MLHVQFALSYLLVNFTITSWLTMLICVGCAVGGCDSRHDEEAVSSRGVRGSCAIGGRTLRTSTFPRRASEDRRPRRARHVQHFVPPTRDPPAGLICEWDHRWQWRRPFGQRRHGAGKRPADRNVTPYSSPSQNVLHHHWSRAAAATFDRCSWLLRRPVIATISHLPLMT